VIDLRRARVITTITVAAGAFSAAASPDKRFVYVTNSTDSTLLIIATDSNKVVDTINLNTGLFATTDPRGVVVSCDSQFVYVASFGSRKVQVLDARSRTIVTQIPAIGGAVNLDITTDGNLAYITMSFQVAIAVAYLNTNLQVDSISLSSDTFTFGMDISCREPLA
jgi:DNA-binding beta-propeller fold protein YncE